MYSQINDSQPHQYQALVDLFRDWREFEEPPRLNGAPDYTANRFDRDQKSFKELEERLNRIKIDDWPIPYQVDWHIVRAEMNGYDFNIGYCSLGSGIQLITRQFGSIRAMYQPTKDQPTTPH